MHIMLHVNAYMRASEWRRQTNKKLYENMHYIWCMIFKTRAFNILSNEMIVCVAQGRYMKAEWRCRYNAKSENRNLEQIQRHVAKHTQKKCSERKEALTHLSKMIFCIYDIFFSLCFSMCVWAVAGCYYCRHCCCCCSQCAMSTWHMLYLHTHCHIDCIFPTKIHTATIIALRIALGKRSREYKYTAETKGIKNNRKKCQQAQRVWLFLDSV